MLIAALACAVLATVLCVMALLPSRKPATPDYVALIAAHTHKTAPVVVKADPREALVAEYARLQKRR